MLIWAGPEQTFGSQQRSAPRTNRTCDHNLMRHPFHVFSLGLSPSGFLPFYSILSSKTAPFLLCTPWKIEAIALKLLSRCYHWHHSKTLLFQITCIYGTGIWQTWYQPGRENILPYIPTSIYILLKRNKGTNPLDDTSSIPCIFHWMYCLCVWVYFTEKLMIFEWTPLCTKCPKLAR